MERFLCIAGCAGGHDFLRQCAELGVQPTLLTLDSLQDAGWPREAIEDLATMPAGLTREQVQNTVAWMARGRKFDRIVALDEGQLLTAAELREHMRIPGMGITTAGYYRDRLAMRISAQESGFAVPEFCRVLNYDDIREFMRRVPAPWMLRVRIPMLHEPPLRIRDPEELWSTFEQMGDRQSHFLLEETMEGEMFTVESIVSECRVVFSVVHRHRSLPGASGIRLIETVDRASRDWTELTALNGGLAPSLGMVRGVTQARFVRSHADGWYRFVEIAASIAGGVGQLAEAATELNLWREWARLEVAHLRGEDYVPSTWFEHYAVSLQYPTGLLRLDDPELKGLDIRFSGQAGGEEILIVRSEWMEKLAQAVNGLQQRLAAR
ncbi:MAG: ATPase [Terracidiphilus sp.]|nr:ATPase [Terracidiphilus sp.]